MSGKNVFTAFQNFLLPMIFFYIQIWIILFVWFSSKLTHAFLYLIYAFLSVKDLLFRNLFLNFDLIMMTCWSSLYIKGVWFAGINLCFIETIELKTVRNFSWNPFKLLSCLDTLKWFTFLKNCSRKILLS